MSSEEINNNFQIKLKKFFKENIKNLLILIGVIIVILLSFLIYKNLQDKNNLVISEKYTRASIKFQQENKDEAKALLENIIINDQGLHFLDWEYADLGHPGIDRIKLFGRTYCEDRDGSSGIDALETLQNGIVKLWYAVQDAQLTDGKRTGNI